jgi:hypothetical protein
MATPTLMTGSEVAAQLKMNATTLRRLRQSGTLPIVGSYTAPSEIGPLVADADVERYRRRLRRLHT